MGLNISNMKKIILAALVVASLFASCSSEKTFKKKDGSTITAKPYGWASKENKVEGVNYELFDFSEALRRMKEGKKVRRIGWGIVDELYIDKDKNINIFYKATTHSSEGFIHIFPSCWSFFTCEDILATDWEEVKE